MTIPKNKEVVNRQCQECGGYELDDGTSELCECSDECDDPYDDDDWFDRNKDDR